MKTKRLSNAFGVIIPFLLLIVYYISLRLTDSFTISNYIAVIASALMLFNRQARALGSVFILLVFIFSGLYGGIILERVDQVAAIDIVSTCVIAACYFLVVVFFIFEKPGDSWSKDVCDKSTRVFICVGLAIAVLRLMFIFLWAI